MRVVIADDHWAVREGLQKALGQRVAIVGEAERRATISCRSSQRWLRMP